MAREDRADRTVTLSPPESRESRRILTVAFIDVADSTALADALDPETFRGLMLRYFDESKRIVERHGGLVEKFIGDAVVAAFGIPRLHEDDPLRAVTAAAEIRARLRALNDEFEAAWGTRISIRTGIETGEAIAGEDASGASVTGPTLNTAARLQQAAAADEILVGETTYRLVRDAVEAEEIGPLELRGKATPVRAWRLLEVIPGAMGVRRRLDSPLVDRERELAQLLAAFDRAAGGMGCQVATVMAPAGVGKSRLAGESVDRIGDRATILQGRCLPYGEGITFWPVVEMLRGAVGIAEADPPADIERKLGDLLSSSRDGARIRDRLAPILGLGTAQPAIQETFWAVRKLLEHAAASRPVVIVFDDIHWGEPTFLDLLEYLTDWIRAAPVLMICLSRAELLDVRPGWAAARPNTELIRLAPLSDAHTQELITNLVGGGRLATQAAARIGQVAEGNPLFVEETLRMMVDTGALVAADGRWELARELSDVAIPPTIQALLAARLDRLEPDERSVLERASVVGRVFGWSAVAALAGEASRPGIAGHLQALMRKELIRPEPSDLEPEDTFRFAHLLVRDAAYRAIPKADRADLHERLAEWIEDRTRERVGEFEEIVGYHLEQAHRTLVDLAPGSSRTDGLARRASERLGAAGRRAFARGDMPAAVSLLTRATALLPVDDRERGGLLPQLAFALMETGDFVRLQEVVGELTSAAASGDPMMQADAAILHLWIRLFTDPEGWATAAQEEGSRALEAFREARDEGGLARASSLLGLVNMMKGDFAAAEGWWQAASTHARRAGDHRDEMESLAWVPLATWAGPTPAEEGTRRATELLRRADGDKKAMSSALMAIGAFEAGMGRFDEARASIRRARSLLEEVALTVWMAGPLTQLSGWVELSADDPRAAERELRWGFDKLREIGEMSWFSTVAGLLGEAVLANGRPDEAEQLAASSRESAAPDDAYSQVLWRTVAAKVHAERGEVDMAERLAREAADIVDRTDFLHLRWHASVTLAQVLERAGRAHEAIGVADRARDEAARKGSAVAERRAAELSSRLRG